MAPNEAGRLQHGSVSKDSDRRWMRRALELAQAGLYFTTPNPSVGCVLVREGQVLGEGSTQAAGHDHAEVVALKAARAAGAETRGSTAYVTLEPCTHTGRTPPCVPALVAAGIARVVIATIDPNPKNNGLGIRALRQAGMAVESGLLGEEARALMAGFFSRMERGRPWVRMKVAASLDGKNALASGESKWITGEIARADGHEMRARACAILTGSSTIVKDDPQLTIRQIGGQPWQGRQPLRIVLDSLALLPSSMKIFSTPGKVLIVAAQTTSSNIGLLEAAGAEVIALPDDEGRVDLLALLKELGQREINELLIESGSRLNGAWIHSGLVDELVLYQAPVLLGSEAISFAEFGIEKLGEKIEWQVVSHARLGHDMRYVLRPIRR